MTQRNLRFYIERGCGMLVLVLLAALMIFLKLKEDHEWDGAISVKGVVLNIETVARGQGRSPDNENVEFEYMVEGQSFRHTQYFSYNTPFQIGQTVPVLYMPDMPWVAIIFVDHSANTLCLLAIGLVAILMLFIIGIGSWSSSHEKQKRKPHQEGIYDQTTL